MIEFYGQTEANLTIGNCPSVLPIRPGWTGRAYPGHDVRLIDGEIAVWAEGDPTVSLAYWQDPEATAAKVPDGWVRSGDLAVEDGEGYLRFVVLAPGAAPSPELAADLQAFVRERLAAHVYPRAIEFLESLPMTTTGKIRRGDLRRLEAERAAAPSEKEDGG